MSQQSLPALSQDLETIIKTVRFPVAESKESLKFVSLKFEVILHKILGRLTKVMKLHRKENSMIFYVVEVILILARNCVLN